MPGIGGGPDNSLGLYLHLPFCKARCSYCAFTTVADDPRQREAYVAALVTEVQQVGAGGRRGPNLELPPQAGRDVASLYLGGGTPSLLSEDQLRRIMVVVRDAFAVRDDAEITLEANPETVSEVTAALWRDLGIGRISLGAQTFQDDVLKALGRRHLAAGIVEAVRCLRQHGPPQLSLDLIAGVSPEHLIEDVHAALRLQPDHLSLYLLEVDELEVGGVTPLARRVASGRAHVPDQDWFADAYTAAAEALAGAGLARYEISNFARPGRASRHNLRYWRLQEVLGFGVASHSLVGHVRHAIGRDTAAYIAAIGSGSPPELQVDRVAPSVRVAEAWILGLRLDEGISAAEAAERGGGEPTPGQLAALAALREESLITCRRQRWRLTPRGVLLSNEVFERLLP